MSCLYDIPEEEALEHCTNVDKCVCHRVMRSQVYRAMALAIGARGRGVQVSFGPAIAAFAQGAFPDAAGIRPPIQVPSMNLEEHARYYDTGPDRESIPSHDVVQSFLAVLRRVYG